MVNDTTVSPGPVSPSLADRLGTAAAAWRRNPIGDQITDRSRRLVLPADIVGVPWRDRWTVQNVYSIPTGRGAGVSPMGSARDQRQCRISDSGQLAFTAPLHCDAVLARVNPPRAVGCRRRDRHDVERDPSTRGDRLISDALVD